MKKWLGLFSILCAAILALVASPDADSQAKFDGKVDRTKVDEAIKKGINFILTVGAYKVDHMDYDNKKVTMRNDELLLYTMIYAGIDEKDERFQKLLEAILDAKLERTYQVALQAMALEALDREKYQWRIAQCGQFLTDNQCKNGQWGYGEPLDDKDIPTGMKRPPKGVDTGGGADLGKNESPEVKEPKEKKGSDVLKKVGIKRRKTGPASGDNSNTQYAVLGLRACIQSGVDIPKDVLAVTEDWWLRCQQSDGGWEYSCKGAKSAEKSYGGMSAGALGSLIILKHYLKKNYKKDPAIQNGLNWMSKNFSVTGNPGYNDTKVFHFYYLYALERLGVLYDTETIGTRDWYKEGAEYILKAQLEDGSWSHYVEDTCFAILFLKRATKPLKDIYTH